VEDLGIFLGENAECVAVALDVVLGAIESAAASVFSFGSGVKSTTAQAISSVVSLVANVWLSIGDALRAAGNFFSLLGASLVLLVNLVPRTLYLAAKGVAAVASGLASQAKISVMKIVEAFHTAPLEMFIGLVACAMLIISSAFLIRKFVRDRQITSSIVLHSTLRTLRFLYVNFVRGLIVVFSIVFKAVFLMVNHLHVARFHHAGDSDDEDEDEGNNNDDDDLIGPLDESDQEDRLRQEDKRRNYNLLLRRREQQGKNRLNAAPGANDTVEDMLFEQVEREREDKLCVICQDKEKCIMILPCRHLCICQDCQGPLTRFGNNVCPICRRDVRQMIKAYL
jgi:hypothetical protein